MVYNYPCLVGFPFLYAGQILLPSRAMRILHIEVLPTGGIGAGV